MQDCAYVTGSMGPCRPPGKLASGYDGGFRLRIHQFKSGVVEGTAMFVPHPRQRADGPIVPTERSLAEIEARAEDNIRRATARAKSAVRRLCLAAQVDRLLTLTYQENQTDLAQGWEDFTRFIRIMRDAMPKWVYVAVAERQKRGAVHFHLAVKGFQDVRRLRAAWRNVVGAGNIDVTNPRKYGGRNGFTSQAARCASCSRYITKYMLKDARETETARHRYRHSRITIPTEVIRLDVCTAKEAGNACLAALAARGVEAPADVFFGVEAGLTWAIGWPHTARAGNGPGNRIRGDDT